MAGTRVASCEPLMPAPPPSAPATFSSADARVVKRLRIAWGLTLAVEGVAMVMAGAYVSVSGVAEGEESAAAWWLWAAGLGVVLLLPLGYTFRMQRYKAGWQGHRVTPAAYTRGNLGLFALLTLLTLLSAAAYAWSATPLPALPALLPGGLALFVTMLNYPTGKPLQPRQPST